MTSILNLSDFKPGEVAEQDPASQSPSVATEYEIVLGRTQIASWLFVTVIAVAICSSLAYLAGERIAAMKAAAISRRAALPTQAVPAPPAAAAELPQASIVVPPKVDLASIYKNAKPAVPLFADPEMGKVYLQIAAVERGMAMLIVEGLRNHGFDSFVAPGPNDKLFRVLIGPLPDPPAFRQAMVAVYALDLATFARKYQK